MTREEIIALALKHTVGGLEFDDDGLVEFFNEAYAAGAATEREKCLEIADQCADADMHASMAANAIRARGNHV